MLLWGLRSAASRMRQMVARLMALAWASLTMVKAISSSVQPLQGRSWSVVLPQAMETTAACVWGGKTPGPAGAGRVLKAHKALGDETLAPEAGGVAVAAESGGDLKGGGLVGAGGTQDEATAQDQGLGSGTGAAEGLELAANFGGQLDGRTRRTRHGGAPVTAWARLSFGLQDIMAPRALLA